MERPVTSKSRGLCRYYNTARGCFAGDSCKFLHGPDEKYTPYDKAKVCKYYVRGHCTRGDRCWFRHELPNAPPEQAQFDAENCSICMEKPITYGLMTDCSHVFCLQCIRQWRDKDGKSSDMVSTGAIKCCPLCRGPSHFITPSTHFFPSGHPRKEEIIDGYRASMARVACKYFEETSRKGKPCCPFGQDCFYRHTKPDGTPHVFHYGAARYMKVYRRLQLRNNLRRPQSPSLGSFRHLRTIIENMDLILSNIRERRDDIEVDPITHEPIFDEDVDDLEAIRESIDDDEVDFSMR
ncbi:hypothetical protein EDC04DRAFT_423974 [Pisolithus marmoratus]|nr:hypothetical protein EDC04DRAFT_423974 [Pisolithus marmoratus]